MAAQPHILLVEDDREQAMLFAQVLSLSGYAVTTAANADEALASLATTPFALLLADWDLPGMKGDALISTVKAEYPAMKTILYSNHVHVEEACTACGADAWMRKTEGITRLRQLMRALLG